MTEARKPTALTLADELEMWTLGEPAATELRRLHAANLDCMEWYEAVKSERDELLEALKEYDEAFTGFNPSSKSSRHKMRLAVIKARSAIAKVTN